MELEVESPGVLQQPRSLWLPECLVLARGLTSLTLLEAQKCSPITERLEDAQSLE